METGTEQGDNRTITATSSESLQPVIESGVHAANTPAKANSGHWRPGTSGNPAGRPKKGTGLKDILEQKMDKQRLAEALLAGAYRGDPTLIRYVFDRVLGTPVQRTEDVTPATLRTFALPIAEALGVPVEDVLLQYEQLKALGPGTT